MFNSKMADSDIRNNGSDGLNEGKKDLKGRGRSPGGRGGGGGGGGGGRRRSRSPIDRHRGGGGGDNKASRRVYVANVPFDVKWNDLKDLFREKVGNVTYCQLFEDEKGQSRGCGLVEFQDAASAQKAIETLHRYNFRSRELVVKEDLDCERDRFGRLILPDAKRGPVKERERELPRERDIYDRPVGFNQGFNQGVNYNTYGLSPQFLESLGISGPLNNRIFVANLDFKVGEKKLEEIFRLAGKVLRVRLYTDASNNSKGHGTVEFEHPVEAVQAISMFHNQKLYGRAMSIRMDKYECEEMPEVLPSKLPAGLEGIGKGLGIGGQPLNIGKSLLNNYNFGNIAPVQPPPPPQQPIPPPNTGLNAFGGMTGMAGAGNMSQLSMSQQGLTPGLSASSVPTVPPSTYGMPGVVNSGDRMGNMGPGQPMVGLSGNPGGLSNLASAQQNVLGAQSLPGPSIPGVNPALGLGAGQAAGPGVVGANPSNLGVYGSYEREFHDDKYRVPQTMTDTIVYPRLPATRYMQHGYNHPPPPPHHQSQHQQLQQQLQQQHQLQQHYHQQQQQHHHHSDQSKMLHSSLPSSSSSHHHSKDSR